MLLYQNIWNEIFWNSVISTEKCFLKWQPENNTQSRNWEIDIIMKKNYPNNKGISVVRIKSVHSSTNTPFYNKHSVQIIQYTTKCIFSPFCNKHSVQIIQYMYYKMAYFYHKLKQSFYLTDFLDWNLLLNGLFLQPSEVEFKNKILFDFTCNIFSEFSYFSTNRVST